jgi:hypothetical protein
MEKKHLCTYFSIYYNTKSDTFKSEPNLMSTCSNLSLTFNMHMRKLNLPALLWYSWYRSIFSFGTLWLQNEWKMPLENNLF